MTSSLPAVPTLALIGARLPLIFPEGTLERQWCVREMAARTVQVMFYAGALEGAGRWLLPNMVVAMTDAQMALQDAASRESWYQHTSRPRRNTAAPTGSAWYSPNSREGVRDETLKKALVPNGAVAVRPGVPATSSKGRYALKADFAQLFDAGLVDGALETAIAAWQDTHLTAAARARIALVRAGAAAASDAVLVKLPTGATVALSSGESSLLTKAVVEEFAGRFLATPAVIWLSESQQKVIDASLATALGLVIDPASVLPDAILADLDAPDGVLLVFCEVVHTDGAVTDLRRQDLIETAHRAGWRDTDLAFLTVFRDRGQRQIREQIGKLAWGTFAWFASEPQRLLILRADGARKLSALR